MFNTITDIVDAIWVNPDINHYDYSEKLNLIIPSVTTNIMADDLIIWAKKHIYQECQLPKESDITSDALEAYANKCKHAAKFMKKIEEFASFIVSYEWKNK